VSDEADAVVSLEVELLGDVLLVLELGYVLLLGDDVSDDDDGDVLVLEDVSLELGVVLVLP
jgi:hypothetical protein